MSKNKRITPAYSSKPETNLKIERTEPVEQPVKCTACGAPLLVDIGSGGVNTAVTRCQECGTQVPPPEAIREPNNQLAKIATNDLTPRCPFCNSVRIEKMQRINFLQFSCNDCRRRFRAPVTKRRAA